MSKKDKLWQIGISVFTGFTLGIIVYETYGLGHSTGSLDGYLEGVRDGKALGKSKAMFEALETLTHVKPTNQEIN